MTYDDLEQQMHLRFQSTLPRGEQLNMSKLPPPRTVPQQVSSCLQIDLRECFGTAPLPTEVSGASRRGEGGLLAGLRHGTPAHRYLRGIPAWRRGSSDRASARRPRPTDASVASSGSHCELVYRIVALLGFVKFTWNEPLLIIK